MKMTPPDLPKRRFMKKGGVKTKESNDYKKGERQVLKENHKRRDHRWCNSKYLHERRSHECE